MSVVPTYSCNTQRAPVSTSPHRTRPCGGRAKRPSRRVFSAPDLHHEEWIEGPAILVQEDATCAIASTPCPRPAVSRSSGTRNHSHLIDVSTGTRRGGGLAASDDYPAEVPNPSFPSHRARAAADRQWSAAATCLMKRSPAMSTEELASVHPSPTRAFSAGHVVDGSAR